MDSPSTPYPKTVDLNNCDKEPIHLLGRIQSHGMLLVLGNETYKLARVSKNVFDFFDLKAASLHTYNLVDVLGQYEGERLQNYLEAQKTQPLELKIKELPYIAIIHATAALTYIELERISEKSEVQISQFHLSTIISELSEVPSVKEMCDKTPALIKKLLGYDRVMLYQFDENWNGKVIAEAREEHLESWLEMHYPATDIPQQARALFLKQGVRIIVDVDSTAVPILPESDEHHKALDLSRCELRAVSPIHIEYLKNMKVGATLTAAIVSNGELWGLIACHNYSPKFINYYQRLSVKFLTQVFSTQIAMRSSNEVLQRINETAVSRSLLVKQMSDAGEILKGLTGYSCTMLDMTEAPAAAAYINGNFSAIGEVPEETQVVDLIDWMYENHIDGIFSTQNLSSRYEKGSAFAKAASGVLCIFIASDAKDCLLWFKPELKQVISWGGNPEKAMQDHGERVSPRKSFARWNQEQEHTSLSWKDYEIASAKALKDTIANIIVKKYAEVKKLNDKLQLAYKDLESFSYSVSHDLRAPLRGIDGFAQIIKEDYFETLDDYGKSSIQRIIDSSKKMNTLIDDVLSFSMVGKDDTSHGTFAMKGVVEESLLFLQIDLVYPRSTISIDEDLPMAYGDERMIFQLLNNLISNALKYSEKADKPLIEIGCITDSEPPIYYVKDNGIGFDDAYSDKIFGIFNRLVRDDEYEGSGIGLAIAQRIINKLDGKIWAESKEGQGATFYFELPMRC